MANQEELDKLFEAALYGRKPPSRFGTPDDQVKSAPAAFQKAQSDQENVATASASPFKADSMEVKPFLAVEASPIQEASSEEAATPEVLLDEKALASLDDNVNAEFEQITDKKIAKARAKRRRERIMFYALLIGSVAGAGGWLVKNPDKIESIKSILTEIRTAVDPTAVAGKYDKSLEKIAGRGDQLGDAATALGGKVVEGEDQSLENEMKQLSGEETTGLSSSEKQKKLEALQKTMGKKKEKETEIKTEKK